MEFVLEDDHALGDRAALLLAKGDTVPECIWQVSTPAKVLDAEAS